MIIMGYDAGTSNAGYNILQVTAKRIKFLEIGMIVSTFKNLTDNVIYKKPTKADRSKAKKQGKRLTKADMEYFAPISEAFPPFYKVVNDLSTEYTLDYFIGERFQTRGNGGPLIEMVSMQLGTFLTVGLQKSFVVKLTTASTWKNKVNSITNLEDMYEYAKQFGFTPHECDSTGMSMYYADQLGITPLELSLNLWRPAITSYARTLNHA